MYNKMTADGFTISFISVEESTINKDQTEFVKNLREEMIRYGITCPLHLYSSKIKKEQRIQDNLEPIMSQKGIKFCRNISQPDFVTKLESQLLQFPN
jgi:hypothetical protein